MLLAALLFLFVFTVQIAPNESTTIGSSTAQSRVTNCPFGWHKYNNESCYFHFDKDDGNRPFLVL